MNDLDEARNGFKSIPAKLPRHRARPHLYASQAPPGEGRGSQQEPELEPLSQIIDELNERFGMNFNERDQLLFDPFEETWTSAPRGGDFSWPKAGTD